MGPVCIFAAGMHNKRASIKKIERLIDLHLVGLFLFSFSNFTFGFHDFI